MKTRSTQKTHRPFWAGLAATLFVALLAAAPWVEANSGAGGTILNTVTVSYRDAGNVTTYTANATTFVTINRVRQALTASGRPTVGTPGKTAAMPAGQAVSSGATASYIIALTANANGGDTYNLTSALANPNNVAGQSVSWVTLQNDGTTTLTAGNPATIALGASVIQANTATTISIPGNSNLVALITDNPTAHKTLVVNGIDYIVTGITPGTAPSNTHVGATYYNTVGTATAETLAVITLAANPGGANVAPAFTANALIGSQVGEQVLVRVNVTAATGATPGTPGTVDFTVTTTDGGGGNPVTTTAITTTFNSSNVRVQKNVRNCGQSTPVGACGATAFTASSAGNPGDVLEYQVLVNNAGLSAANLVTATDAVPVYTRLISFTGAYGDGGTLGSGLGTQNFATISDGTTTAAVTIQSTDAVPPAVGSGDAGGITETSPIHFFLGTTSNNTTGGSIAPGATYTILYRVKIN
jgi:uncharacterized repeat protein (TIGR01451 family)